MKFVVSDQCSADQRKMVAIAGSLSCVCHASFIASAKVGSDSVFNLSVSDCPQNNS